MLTNFTGFTTPGVVSVMLTVGSRIYGMIGSGRNTGRDEPFCFDTSTNTFVSISGVTAGNSPLTPSTSGNWVPPTMALVGVKLIVTHPGYTGGSNFFGWFDLTTPSTPVWNAGNVTGQPFHWSRCAAASSIAAASMASRTAPSA